MSVPKSTKESCDWFPKKVADKECGRLAMMTTGGPELRHFVSILLMKWAILKACRDKIIILKFLETLCVIILKNNDTIVGATSYKDFTYTTMIRSRY